MKREQIDQPTQSALSIDEENVMRMTFTTTMLRAAQIIEKITEGDVLDMQAMLLSEGASLEKVARVDRAMVAAAHLRACAEGKLK